MEFAMVYRDINVAQITILRKKTDLFIKLQQKNQLQTSKGRVSGIPWQITSLTDVQHDAGKL